MKVDTEKQIRTLLKKFEMLGNIERATWYEWRQAALEFAKEGTDPMDVVLRAWEIVGHDTAKSYFPILDKSKDSYLQDIAK